MIGQEHLVPGSRVRFPGDATVVTLVQVKQGSFWDFVYRDADGSLADVTLAEEEIGEIELVSSTSSPRFTGNPRQFRLGVEALRIQNAFRHDMAGLAVSNISPLPHQLDAVYGSFLEEPALRFLLADDPGAGKTIMAGLYIKELMLRRAADRVLIVTPANLRPQWQRELAERFDIHCIQFDSSTLDSNPTQNAWDLHDFVIVSRDFLKREEVINAFAAAEKHWDLAILDEAHGYTLHVDGKGLINKRSERYKAAERIAEKAHRLILLTATPHSGRNESLWGLLRLLDPDAYGDRCPKHGLSLNPNQYRKVAKERMVDMAGNKLFRPRFPHTVGYELRGAELDLYDAVTNFVSKELAEIRGAGAASAAGFALTTMQRRLASSVRAIRRTLGRRIDRLERAIEDPAAYLRTRRDFKATAYPDDAEMLADLDEDDLWKLEEQALEEWLPATISELEDELVALRPLLVKAQETEEGGTEVKLNELLDVVKNEGLRDDQTTKLLIFTEHKDTLDYLVEKLQPNFTVAVIHGGMKLRERIAAEREFRERAQIMVATEAAGEGINLQFCHLMMNYDIPWNPNRLEQRMGRIHRIGQTRDVHIYNLVATNTREGHVLATLLRKMENMGRALGDEVFDVIGETFNGYRLRDLIEQVIAGELSKEAAAEAIGGDLVDPEMEARFRALTENALATHHLDWQAEADRAARAEEKRLPPGYLERFFRDAIEYLGGTISDRLDRGTLRVKRTPDHLVARSRLTGATREVFPSYERLTFDKAVALRQRTTDEDRAMPEAELCGPGHPLFDSMITAIIDSTHEDVERGARFVTPDADEPAIVYFVVGDSVDGNGEVVHRAFSTVMQPVGGSLSSVKLFLYDLLTMDTERTTAEVALSETDAITAWARRHEFERHFQQARDDRIKVSAIQEDYLRRSFAAILQRHQETLFDLDAEVEQSAPGAEGRLRKSELGKAQVEEKRNRRLAETQRGRNVKRGPVRILATALVLPGQEDSDDRSHPAFPETKHSNSEIETIAINEATRFETESRDADIVKSVEADNVGFDLLSLKGIERRCIEVKGRAGVGAVELTWSEFAKAIELGDDYWLYVVLDCASSKPRLYRVQNPSRALANAWSSNLDVRYEVAPQPIIDASEDQL
ncbi:helicase-related protein [Rhodococcus cerastii]|uniref:Helicase-related protein n=1 Tax=Rhodococcus cerastii TaxID=908616 RepID=A0ABU4D1G0_9NOCA|nr:helicase-related protein [Rhodococcus cerastii]MDV6303540.1 helicase-related protein [Rhodococcus cerastii]